MGFAEFQKLSSIFKDWKVRFVEDSQEIEFACDSEAKRLKLSNLIQKELNLTLTELYDFKLRLKIEDLPFFFYWGEQDFRDKIFTKNGATFNRSFDSDLAVINQENSQIENYFFDGKNKKTFVDLAEDPNNFLFLNSRAYIAFIQFLSQKEHQEDAFFYFVDHFSWEKDEIVFVSAQKEGKLTIPFPRVIPEFDQKINYSIRLKNFIDSFPDNDKTQKLPKFIKAELFKQLAVKPKSERLMAWISSMDEILNVANQNFEVYLADVSMSNVKKQYIETKDKYFAQLRDILGKITSQIVALPVSTSAVALVSYTLPKTYDQNFSLSIIAGAFGIYTFFALHLLKLYLNDIDDSAEQISFDFKSLDTDDFFAKFKDEKQYFADIKTKLERKMSIMRNTIWVYIALLVFTNCLLLYKILAEIIIYPFIGVSIFFIGLLYFILPSKFNKKLNKNNSN